MATEESYRRGRQKTHLLKENSYTVIHSPKNIWIPRSSQRVLRSSQYHLYLTKKQEARSFSQFHLCSERCNFLRSQVLLASKWTKDNGVQGERPPVQDCSGCVQVKIWTPLTTFFLSGLVRSYACGDDIRLAEAIVDESGTTYSVRGGVGNPWHWS